MLTAQRDAIFNSIATAGDVIVAAGEVAGQTGVITNGGKSWTADRFGAGSATGLVARGRQIVVQYSAQANGAPVAAGVALSRDAGYTWRSRELKDGFAAGLAGQAGNSVVGVLAMKDSSAQFYTLDQGALSWSPAGLPRRTSDRLPEGAPAKCGIWVIDDDDLTYTPIDHLC